MVREEATATNLPQLFLMRRHELNYTHLKPKAVEVEGGIEERRNVLRRRTHTHTHNAKLKTPTNKNMFLLHFKYLDVPQIKLLVCRRLHSPLQSHLAQPLELPWSHH